MKLSTVLIKEKEYPIVVTNWVLRKYGESIGEPTLEGTFKSFDFIGRYTDKNKSKEVSFEDLEKLARIGFLAIQEGCEEEKVDCDLREKDLFNAVTEVPVAAAIVIAIFHALPRQKEGEETAEKKSQMTGTTS